MLIISILATLVLAEKYRPHFHYTHSTNTILDPVALFRDLSGNFNMFYLHNNNMSSGHSERVLNWGHASSRDMIQWREEELVFKGGAHHSYL